MKTCGEMALSLLFLLACTAIVWLLVSCVFLGFGG